MTKIPSPFIGPQRLASYMECRSLARHYLPVRKVKDRFFVDVVMLMADHGMCVWHATACVKRETCRCYQCRGAMPSETDLDAAYTDAGPS